MNRSDIKKPSYEGLLKAQEAVRKLNDRTEVDAKLNKLFEKWEAEAEYEEIECVCPMTGTIEYMKRRL